jgi:hypothetical protein
MIKNTINQGVFFIVLLVCLSACEFTNRTQTVTGLAHEREPLPHAKITLQDATGKQLNTETNARGVYRITTRNLTPPLLVSVVAQGKGEDCTSNAGLRPICMAAVVMQIPAGKNLVANINPLTDRIVSDIAVSKVFIGPQQWVD